MTVRSIRPSLTEVLTMSIDDGILTITKEYGMCNGEDLYVAIVITTDADVYLTAFSAPHGTIIFDCKQLSIKLAFEEFNNYLEKFNLFVLWS